MFCDLVGSTALSRKLDAEDLRDLISEFQETCGAAIARFDGFIARYMGDGMLVYFGYPKAHEDSAARSVRAGLAVVAAVAELDSKPVRRQVRVGIATGNVVVGDLIGEGASEERAVVGETPNLAARLQGLAEPNTVVISDRTRRLAQGEFELEDLGEHTLKGFADPVPAWRAVGERVSARATERAASLGGFVGREFELGLFASRFGCVREHDGREGRVLLLGGAAGSGKTRLVEEAMSGFDAPHSTIRLQCARRHRATALRPMIDQITSAAGFAIDDDEARRRAKTQSWVLAWSNQPESDLTAIASLLSIHLGDGQELAGEPEEQKTAMLAAIWHWLSAQMADTPLVFVVEDVQWADATTLDLLTGLVDSAAKSRMMLVITHRPGFEPAWAISGHVTALSVGRLTPIEARALVVGVADDTSLPAETIAEIVERGDGVPAYLTELTRAVIAAASLGSARLVVPETLHDSIAAQLDRLDARARELAQVAAAIGREFSVELLRRVYDGGHANLDAGLGALIEAGLVIAPGLDRGSTHTFRHALLRDVAYQSLLKRAQRSLHDRIATVLTEQLAAEAQSDPGHVGWQLEHAARDGEAATWWRLAAERAAERAADDEALSYYERAAAALERTDFSVDDEASERLAEIYVDIGARLRLAGDLEGAHAKLDAAESIAEHVGRHSTLSRVWFVRGNLAFRSGDVDACLAAHERARSEAERAGSVEGAARALGGIADAMMARGDYAGGERACRECIAMAEAHGFRRLAASNAAIYPYHLLGTLRRDEAIAAAERAVPLARAAKNRRALVTSLVAHGMAIVESGESERAQRYLDRITAEALNPEVFLRVFQAWTQARIWRSQGRRIAGDQLMREHCPLLPESLELWTMLDAGGLASDPADAYRENFERLATRFTTLHESHFRLSALTEMIEATVFRRDIDGARRVLALARPHVRPGRAPNFALWVDLLAALLQLWEHPDDPVAAERFGALQTQMRRGGSVPAAALFDAALAGGIVDAAPRSAARP
jgi:class 3 adenylate cyclase/tetratricopeptide (TPR) repeat protein